MGTAAAAIEVGWRPLPGLDPLVPDRMPILHAGLQASPSGLLLEAYLSTGHRHTLLPASLAEEAGLDPEAGELYRDPLLPGVRLVLQRDHVPIRLIGRRRDRYLPVRVKVAFHDETIVGGLACLGSSIFRVLEARLELGAISLSIREEARPAYGFGEGGGPTDR